MKRKHIDISNNNTPKIDKIQKDISIKGEIAYKELLPQSVLLFDNLLQVL